MEIGIFTSQWELNKNVCHPPKKYIENINNRFEIQLRDRLRLTTYGLSYTNRLDTNNMQKNQQEIKFAFAEIEYSKSFSSVLNLLKARRSVNFQHFKI